MANAVALDPETLAALADAIKSAGLNGAKRKKSSAPRTTPELKAKREAANDAECIRLFTEAGYKDVKPRVNVLTHKRWVAAGRMVREGEKAIKVGPKGHQFNLFHIDQTDPMTAEPTEAAKKAA